MGDGGFTFNRLTDQVKIIGYKPKKCPKNSQLTNEERKYNQHLSQMRVVIENVIARVKNWRIIKGVFRHWRNGNGPLNINNILMIVVALSNRQIKQNPPREDGWVAPEWMEVFQEDI